jgi:hypothetical protein
MSLNAATIEFLLARGLTGEDLLEVARRQEQRSDPTAAKRKRDQRERERVEAEVRMSRRDVTRDTSEPSPNEYISNPLPTPPVEAEASTAPKGRERGSKIPEDWQQPPVPELPDEARKLAEQWLAAAYAAEAEAFRNFWLAESGAKSRKSNWNRAWYNRIVQIHGKVMRDAKFAPPHANGTRRLSAEQYDQNAEFFARIGRDEDAQRNRAEAARIRGSTGPPRPIGKLIQDVRH